MRVACNIADERVILERGIGWLGDRDHLDFRHARQIRFAKRQVTLFAADVRDNAITEIDSIGDKLIQSELSCAGQVNIAFHSPSTTSGRPLRT